MADQYKWYHSKQEIEENSLSRKDGISLKKENNFRKIYSRFLRETGQKFNIEEIIISTATVFCHRFFLRRSHAKHDKHRIAITCLFLASKSLEKPLSLDKFKEEGWKETFNTVFKNEILVQEERIKVIIQDEMTVLEAINFDFDVELPYKYFVQVVKKINGIPKDAIDVALCLINDAFFTSLSLQFKPQKIAGAAFHLAYQLLKLDLPFQNENGLLEMFLITTDELKDISDQMLDLYERRPLE